MSSVIARNVVRSDLTFLLSPRLIEACQISNEDPATMLQKAGSEHIPVNPSAKISSSIAVSSTQAPIPTPITRPTIPELLSELETADAYRDQIIYRRSLPAREPQFGILNRILSPEILRALEVSKDVAEGEFKFYKHQAAAINAFWGKDGGAGNNVVVSTPTASGKSVIYQVPTLCALMDESDPEASAMFIYPTKVRNHHSLDHDPPIDMRSF